MAWNDDGNGKDPWQRDRESPTDLDKIVQDWQRRLGSILGGSGGRGPGGGSGGWIVIVLLLIALVSLLLACLFLYLEIREYGGFGAVKGRLGSVTAPLIDTATSFWV